MEKMNIMMKSNKYIVTRIVKKTKSYMFEDVKVGDELLFEIPIKSPGRNSKGGTYAPRIKIYNLTNGTSTEETFNNLPKRLESFKLEIAGDL